MERKREDLVDRRGPSAPFERSCLRMTPLTSNIRVTSFRGEDRVTPTWSTVAWTEQWVILSGLTYSRHADASISLLKALITIPSCPSWTLQGKKGKRLFRYERRLRGNEEVKRIILEIWTTNSNISVESRLTLCRKAIVKWSREFHTNSQKEITDWKEAWIS